MAQYRKKPVVIDAVQWTCPFKEVPDWISEALYKDVGSEGWLYRMGDELKIVTLEGEMTASVGDWIIRGVNGEIYPCKPDIFEKTHELVWNYNDLV